MRTFKEHILENPSPLFIFALALVCLITGLSKGGFGGTTGALSTPILTLFVSAATASGLVLPILLLGDAFSMTAYWRKWDSGLLKRMLPAAALGIVGGALYLNFASAAMAKITLGVFCLAFVLFKLLEQKATVTGQYVAQAWHAPTAGFAAGGLSAVANAGGPPFSMFMLSQNLRPQDFVSTAALFFASVNLFKLPIYIWLGIFHPTVLVQYVWLMPLVPLGVWLGRKIVVRINRRAFEIVVLVSLFVTGVLLLIQ